MNIISRYGVLLSPFFHAFCPHQHCLKMTGHSPDAQGGTRVDGTCLLLGASPGSLPASQENLALSFPTRRFLQRSSETRNLNSSYLPDIQDTNNELKGFSRLTCKSWRPQPRRVDKSMCDPSNVMLSTWADRRWDGVGVLHTADHK